MKGFVPFLLEVKLCLSVPGGADEDKISILSKNVSINLVQKNKGER